MCQGLGHIIDIAAGGSFCMVLNSMFYTFQKKFIFISCNLLKLIVWLFETGEGTVYVWGFGILGLGPKVQNVLKPTPIPQTLFGNNPYEPNEKVIYFFILKLYTEFVIIKIFF